MPGTQHAMDYVEISVSDLPAAKAFYEGAFGWAFNDYGPGYAGIRSLSDPEVEVGGLDAEGEPGGPLVLLWSHDLDASLAAVEAAGGRSPPGPTTTRAGAGSTSTTPVATSWASTSRVTDGTDPTGPIGGSTVGFGAVRFEVFPGRRGRV